MRSDISWIVFHGTDTNTNTTGKAEPALTKNIKQRCQIRTSLLRLLLVLVCRLRAKCIQFGSNARVEGAQKYWHKDPTSFKKQACVHSCKLKERKNKWLFLFSPLPWWAALLGAKKRLDASQKGSVRNNANRLQSPWHLIRTARSPGMSTHAPIGQSSLHSAHFDGNLITEITNAQQGVTPPSRQRVLALKDRDLTKHKQVFHILPI